METQPFPSGEVTKRLMVDNPWWGGAHTISPFYSEFKPRPYFELLYPLIENIQINRAVVLMGPRRVGKTVILHHAILKLLETGISPQNILYCSLDTPIYSKLPMETLLNSAMDAANSNRNESVFCFFDEVQYHKDWEIHLKSLVDGYKTYKFTVSGSAAAALRLKSNESGAGRFTDFFLPPLSFYEYLELTQENKLLLPDITDEYPADGISIQKLNILFLEYINYGGYPEVLTNTDIKSNLPRFLKNDIIEKVLLKDLPGLYGIQDIQELNSLFSTLAYNTGNEITYESLSQNSGVAKNTIKRYLEYLKAAFLIRTLQRVDFNSRTFKRENFIKVYLVNCSMRTALFAPVTDKDTVIGHLVETAIFSQWFHNESGNVYYARWPDGEVDLVHLSEKMKPDWLVEIKWTDRYWEKPEELKPLLSFCRKNNLKKALVTSLTITGRKKVQEVELEFVPASWYCYIVGKNSIESKIWGVP